jgi:DNA-binding IscR family transcriptional regulator
VLAKAASAITLGDVHRAAHPAGSELPPEEWAKYSDELARLARSLQQALERPLIPEAGGSEERPPG